MCRLNCAIALFLAVVDALRSHASKTGKSERGSRCDIEAERGKSLCDAVMLVGSPGCEMPRPGYLSNADPTPLIRVVSNHCTADGDVPTQALD